MRLFVAINFPSGVIDHFYSGARLIRSNSIRCRISRPENIHLTLAFIGETNRAGDAQKALSKVSGKPFELCAQGYGEFSRSGIVFAKINPSPELSALAESVRRELTDLGFDIDTKPFKPHITLCREFVPFDDFPYDKLGSLLDPKAIPVSHISLMKSERIGGKLTYTEIYTKKL